MAIYRVVICDECKIESVLNAETREWFVYHRTLTAFYISAMDSTTRMPEEWKRGHVCRVCAVRIAAKVLAELQLVSDVAASRVFGGDDSSLTSAGKISQPVGAGR